MMAFSKYVAKRNSYSYPAVGLRGHINCWTEVHFASTHQLDCHQKHLLLSDENEQIVLGYLSTIFWGYYSGKDNAIRSARAQGRAQLALDGKDRRSNGRMRGVKDIGVDKVADEIRVAFDSLRSDYYAEALGRLCGLPQLRVAFASKVCAFLIPAKCGVADSVIAESYPGFGFSVDDNGNVRNTPDNRRNYAAYCSFLQEQADALNSQGEPFQWKDRDGLRYPWRAVDIERALY
jgi:hypothetical protein